ncbi:hypothetical protein [Agromyces larvae]|uniref:HD domain-containing protein n=1 Tax=Agromyces larvae TaxID=2929802 RepID=A0ABY4BUI8_9MICO|nr:hypothetical protein [Agromyces larvae]UOE42876.1 hypothetical protein MTO99_11830 [Agromyces larvae]
MTSLDDAARTADAPATRVAAELLVGAPASAPAGPLRPRRQAQAAEPPAAAPPVEALASRRSSRAASGQRYYLCCIEPSGEYVEVIVALTDAGRRRYFTTRDGSRMTEVDEGYFARRSTGEARSMLELDDREMGELETELQFARPVRGRDPLSEPEWAVFLPAIGAAVPTVVPVAEPEPGPEPEPELRAEASAVETGAEASEPEPEPEPEPETAVAVAEAAVAAVTVPEPEPEPAAAEAAAAERTVAEPELEPEAAPEPTPAASPSDPADAGPAASVAESPWAPPTPPAVSTPDLTAPEPLSEEASVTIESSASPAGTPDDRNWTIEEFEHLMSGTITADPRTSAPAAAPIAAPAPAAAPAAAPAGAPVAAAAPADAARDLATQVALAKGIAFVAHRGQVDRVGAAYIDHPARLAERFDAASEPIGAAAAWLHDVLERTDLTAQDLLEAGVVPAVVEVVQVLTRGPELSDDAYYARIGRHPLARRVKLADLDDDTAPWRVRRLEYDERVQLALQRDRARALLGAA